MSGSVVFDYNARESDEINLRKGQAFRLLQTFDDDWWLVECGGKKGLAPSNYLQIKPDKAGPEATPELQQEENSSARKGSSSSASATAHKHKVPAHQSSHETLSAAPHSKELSRLRVLRQEAAVKIDNLRNAVDSYETSSSNNGNDDAVSVLDSMKPNKVEKVHLPVHSPSPAKHPSSASKVVHPRALHQVQRETSLNPSPEPIESIQAIPKVALDKTSIDYISRIVQERIHREFSTRDQRLMEKTQQMIHAALTDFAQHFHLHEKEMKSASEAPSSTASHQHNRPHHLPALKSVSSDKIGTSASTSGAAPQLPLSEAETKVPRSAGSNSESRIPRIKLPKISPTNNGIGSDGDGQQHSQRQSRGPALIVPAARGGHPESGRQSMKKRDAHQAGYQFKPMDGVQLDGVQYAQCRTNVSATNQDLDCIAQHGSAPFSQNLKLKHVFGYYGDSARHGGLSVGKNILWLTPIQIAYPAAALIVVLDIVSGTQSFLTGHTDDVLAIALNTPHQMLASTQIGAEGGIFIWDVSKLHDGNTIAHHTQTALTLVSSTLRNITGLDFSADGMYLLATVVEESKNLYIFDWMNNQVLCRVKAGHIDSCEILFNPYAFTPFMESVPKDNPERLPGCYTLVSRSAKQIKFWTLKQIITYDPTKRKHQSKSIQYVLEGMPATNVSKSHQKNVDFTSICCGTDPDQRQTGSQVFVGLSTGAIQVWIQLVEEVQGEGTTVAAVGATWTSRAKLLVVVEGVHESGICEFSFLPAQSQLLTCDTSGILNMWELHSFAKGTQPMTHLDSLQIDEVGMRCAIWHPDGQQVIIGTATNCILSLSWASNAKREFQFQYLITSHTGKVRRLATNHQATAAAETTVEHVFSTISNDKTIKLWDGCHPRFLTQLAFEKQVTAIEFSADGEALIIGNESGEVSVVRSESFVQFLIAGQKLENGTIGNDWVVTQSKDLFAENAKRGSSSSSSSSTAAVAGREIVEIRCSPTGQSLAVGCKDGHIYLLSFPSLRKVGICKGHTSHVRNMDFSSDGKYLKTTDAARDLLHWDLSSMQRITNPQVLKAATWSTNSCVYGWGLQGVCNRRVRDGKTDQEISCVARSSDGLVLAAAGTHTASGGLKLFPYPCLADCVPRVFSGHSAPITDMAFIRSDKLITLGGNDCCMILWDVFRE